MNEFAQMAQFQRIEAVFQEILHRLYVVVGAAFQCLDLFRIGQAEVFKNAVQFVDLVIFEAGELRQAVLAKGYKVLNFNKNAIPDQRIFAEISGEFFGMRGVAPVDGRNGRKHGWCRLSVTGFRQGLVRRIFSRMSGWVVSAMSIHPTTNSSDEAHSRRECPYFLQNNA